mmetsp:Transcript_9112/g.12644  ORF Transcript_9112/g.12644 Transcript_9112/m.12644 type:complete len:478 (-) Transcript_9112:39-1472(-)
MKGGRSQSRLSKTKNRGMRVFLTLAGIATMYLVGVSWQRSFVTKNDDTTSTDKSSSMKEQARKKARDDSSQAVSKKNSDIDSIKKNLKKIKENKWRIRENRRREISFYVGGKANESLLVPSFWIPTEVTHVEHGDPRVTLCKLDIDNYWRNPSRTPMFRDLVSGSGCGRGKSDSLSNLYQDAINNKKFSPLVPTGFIFHESRVGSTLIANMLASVPTNLVFSESAPPTAILNHCRNCSPEKKSRLLEQIITLMGASPFHSRLFFKFQSITVPNIAILSAAFPNTPWIFVYREPVQVMMSHFKHGAGRNAPCLRELRRPRAETAKILELDQSAAARVPPESYCAAHLAMLCESALRNDIQAGKLALMVDYASLPGALVHYILPNHFHVDDLDFHDKRRMLDVASVYSKLRKPIPSDRTAWTGDSKAKEQAATTQIQNAADLFLYPRFEKLKRATLDKTNGEDLSKYAHLTLLEEEETN